MIPILLADDHPFLRAGVEAVLRGSTYEIVAMVANGEAALEALSNADPAVCLLDIRMPGLSGVQVLEQIRNSGDNRPVVLLTASLNDEDLLAAVRAGVNGIVLKDGAEDQLLACLDAVMEGQRAVPPDLLQRALDVSLKPASHPFANLSPRERQIAQLVGEGMRNREIAERLGMTEGTIKVYLHAVYQKLHLDNRTELALLAHGKNSH